MPIRPRQWRLGSGLTARERCVLTLFAAVSADDQALIVAVLRRLQPVSLDGSGRHVVPLVGPSVPLAAAPAAS
jgi:hypothetical protein